MDGVVTAERERSLYTVLVQLSNGFAALSEFSAFISTWGVPSLRMLVALGVVVGVAAAWGAVSVFLAAGGTRRLVVTAARAVKEPGKATVALVD